MLRKHKVLVKVRSHKCDVAVLHLATAKIAKRNEICDHSKALT